MCNKAVNTPPSAIKFIKYVKAVNTYPFVFDSVPDQYKTKEMCHNTVSNDQVC